MLLRFICLVTLTLFIIDANMAQADLPIELNNPSFEDMPRHSKAPRGWYDCGSPFESPPDVHPTHDAAFNVNRAPFSGDTYLGLVVRDNDTNEAVGQRLKRPIEAGKCYEFSIALARSDSYISLSRKTSEEVNYTTPAKLRIYGGNNYCVKAEMLAESSLVKNTRWLVYNFRIEPQKTHKYIVLEAYYNTPALFLYNGHILVDSSSAIVPIPCEEPKELAIDEPEVKEDPVTEAPPQNINVSPSADPRTKPEPPVVTTNTPNTTLPSTPPVATNTPPAPPTEEEMTLVDVKRKDLKAGQKIQIKNLFFSADKSEINSDSYTALNNLYKFLNRNQDIVIEVGGHTNSTPPDDYCDKLSTARAKAVVDFLAKKGIERERLQYKGYGKRNPVASNRTPVGRKRNQRVEVKVVSFDG
ncbi:MAG: OmpA family protein [Saprospiraceae bacterium]